MLPEQLQSALVDLDAQGLLRRRRVLDGVQGARVRVDGREYLSFSSNDYLGLAGHPALAEAACKAASEVGVGAGAAHLLTGHHRLHHDLERELAAFVGMPAALLFFMFIREISRYFSFLGASLCQSGSNVFQLLLLPKEW